MERILTQRKQGIQEVLPLLMKKKVVEIARAKDIDSDSWIMEWISRGINQEWDFSAGEPKRGQR